MNVVEPPVTSRKSATFVAESPYVRRAIRSRPKLRLFCFPYAGIGASLFHTWADLLPHEVEVIAVQLPGREDRSRESTFSRLRPMVRTLAHALRPYLTMEFALYGHCSGALLAFELAHELNKSFGLCPRHLVVGAQAAPQVPLRHPPIHHLEDGKFVASLSQLGGAPPELIANKEFLEYLLPVIRNDFTLWEQYTYNKRPPLPLNLTVLGGHSDDRISAADLNAWCDHTTGGFAMHEIEGDHYFVNHRTAQVAALLTDILLQTNGSELSATTGHRV